MSRSKWRWLGMGALALLGLVPAALAEDAPEDAAIETIRDLATISANDQTRIQEWVQTKVTKLDSAAPTAKTEAIAEFRTTFQKNFANAKNSPAFKSQLATQTALVAATVFARPKLDAATAWSMTNVLLEMNALETMPGLLAGLKCPISSARLVAVRGITDQRDAIVREKRVADIVSALQTAGIAEKDPVVLTHIYRALAMPGSLTDVVPAYAAILDRRLGQRRTGVTANDGAELEAFEFFRLATPAPGVVANLTPEQRSQFAVRIGTFLRADAQRYAVAGISSDEVARLEMAMESAEAVLVLMVGARQAVVADELSKGGYERRAEVVTQVFSWVGNPETKQPGVLNAAPWNVPIGAP